MEPKDPCQDSLAGAAFDARDVDASRYSLFDIDTCIRRAHALRATTIAAFGRRLSQTIGSLWRRPGRMIPKSYRTS